jgi:hypothetical protein
VEKSFMKLAPESNENLIQENLNLQFKAYANHTAIFKIQLKRNLTLIFRTNCTEINESAPNP